MANRRQYEIELKAVPAENCKRPIYANRVDITRVAAEDNWSVTSLNVNFGVLLPYSTPDREEQEDSIRKEFAHGEYFISGRDVIAYGGANEPELVYYSVDLKKLIPEEWDFKITKIGKNLRQIGVVAYKPGFLAETDGVHALDASDLRGDDSEQCDTFYRAYYTEDRDAKVQCQRANTHDGDHQSFENDFLYAWNEGGASRSPTLPFGFACQCPYCEKVEPGGNTGVKVCFGCGHWLMLEKQRDDDSFIIGGRHYRPGAGGFGGRKFTVKRNDGTIWKGELFTQGEAPPWMRHRFPDNAEFVQDPKPESKVPAVSWTQLLNDTKIDPVL